MKLDSLRKITSSDEMVLKFLHQYGLIDVDMMDSPCHKCGGMRRLRLSTLFYLDCVTCSAEFGSMHSVLLRSVFYGLSIPYPTAFGKLLRLAWCFASNISVDAGAEIAYIDRHKAWYWYIRYQEICTTIVSQLPKMHGTVNDPLIIDVRTVSCRGEEGLSKSECTKFVKVFCLKTKNNIRLLFNQELFHILSIIARECVYGSVIHSKNGALPFCLSKCGYKDVKVDEIVDFNESSLKVIESFSRLWVEIDNCISRLECTFGNLQLFLNYVAWKEMRRDEHPFFAFLFDLKALNLFDHWYD